MGIYKYWWGYNIYWWGYIYILVGIYYILVGIYKYWWGYIIYWWGYINTGGDIIYTGGDILYTLMMLSISLMMLTISLTFFSTTEIMNCIVKFQYSLMSWPSTIIFFQPLLSWKLILHMCVTNFFCDHNYYKIKQNIISMEFLKYTKNIHNKNLIDMNQDCN